MNLESSIFTKEADKQEISIRVTKMLLERKIYTCGTI
jgi:hypothetical protein